MKYVRADFFKLSSLTASIFITAQMLSGCAEPAGSGVSVTIPAVQITCATARCRAATTARAFLIYTTSGCGLNMRFGETVAGSNNSLACNSGGCSGSINSFIDAAGASAATIREGFYAVCVVLDFNANYIGTALTGEDTTGALADSFVTTGSAQKSVSAFTDI
jgi:hypothetical protein